MHVSDPRAAFAGRTGTSSMRAWPTGLRLSRLLCRIMCERRHMATNLSLDPGLIEQAVKGGGERTKKAAVTRALQEYIARRRQKHLLELMGKLEWDESFDYKAERSRK